MLYTSRQTHRQTTSSRSTTDDDEYLRETSRLVNTTENVEDGAVDMTVLNETLGVCARRWLSEQLSCPSCLLWFFLCAGCLVVITDHGPRAEVARALRHELVVDSGERRLEGLEEERQKREEEEIGEERQTTNTTHR